MTSTAIAFLIGSAIYLIHQRLKRSVRWIAWFRYKLWPRCEYCGCLGGGLKLHSSGTAYYVPPEKYDYMAQHPEKDPNRDRLLCDFCAEDHYQYWNDMWSDYYAGRL